MMLPVRLTLEAIAPLVLYAAAGLLVIVLAFGWFRPAARSLRVAALHEGLGRPSDDDAFGIPLWATIVGGLLVLATLGLLVQAYFGFEPPAATATVAVESPLQEAGRPGELNAWYVADRNTPAPGAPLDAGPANKPVTVTPGDLVLRGPSHDLVEVQPDGTLVPAAQSNAGARAWLPNAGMWDRSNQRFAGIAAVFNNGNWNLDMTGVSAANPNSDFRAGNASDPLPGYTVSPSDGAYTVSIMVDGSGPFVRIQANADTAFLQVDGGAPVNSLDGVPVTLRGQIRAHTAGALNLTIWDVTGDSGKVRSFTDREPAAEDWTTLTTRAPQVVFPSPDDYFSIGIVDVKAGDWFDVRELSVFLGTF
ncbi:MAG: hypothetical protein JO352_19030 [Chloroflexi bacterium]|nr:hypothetical protein [Chloroflexota bacterium]MBV9598745.1 hypothetical protein [Chloroflexota bacterium]